MTRDEIRTLLAHAAALTRDWAPTTVDVDVWLELLADLPYDDALTALAEHGKRTHLRPVPADIRAGVKRLRADRLERAPYAVPDADPDDVPAYLDALRSDRHRTADGLEPRPVLELIAAATPKTVDQALHDARRALPPAAGDQPRRALPPVDDPDAMARARAELDTLRPPPPAVTADA